MGRFGRYGVTSAVLAPSLVVVLALVVLLALPGCATSEQQIAKASEIKTTDDSFRPFKEYSTGPIKSGNVLGVGAKQLVGRVDRKSGALTMVLQFQIVYVAGNKRRYEQARNVRAEPLAFNTVPRRADCPRNKDCTYDELFLVTIPEAELRAASAEGYQVKAFAKNGPDILVSIPKPLITNLFAQIDADRGAAGGVPSPAAAVAARPPRT